MADFPIRHIVTFTEGDCGHLTETAPDRYCCPVCGYDGISLMYEIPGREVWDFLICPSCLVEFGADDVVTKEQIAEGMDHEAKWTKLRKQWLSKVPMTDEIRAQLMNIGIVAS